MVVQKTPDAGMVSFNQFKYIPYNTDFGPFTLLELANLTKILNRSHREIVLQVPPESKVQARCVALIACYLMLVKMMSS